MIGRKVPSVFGRGPRSSLPLQRTLHASSLLYAGHNKWSKVKHIKGDKDAKRVAAIKAMNGETDTSQNHYLAAALHQAKVNQMPKSTVEEALKRATSKKDQSELKTVRYEALTKSGIAVIVECFVANPAKTNAEIKHIFKKNEATPSKVDYLFHQTGRIVFAPGTSGKTLADLSEVAIDYNAEE
ncbi:hypothetical protein HDU91_003235, partial [Kappamyces sp. JEL0680]